MRRAILDLHGIAWCFSGGCLMVLDVCANATLVQATWIECPVDLAGWLGY